MARAGEIGSSSGSEGVLTFSVDLAGELPEFASPRRPCSRLVGRFTPTKRSRRRTSRMTCERIVFRAVTSLICLVCTSSLWSMNVNEGRFLPAGTAVDFVVRSAAGQRKVRYVPIHRPLVGPGRDRGGIYTLRVMRGGGGGIAPAFA